MGKKILAVASAGGHWVQINRLKPLFNKHHVSFITTQNVNERAKIDGVYIVMDANNKEKLKSLIMSVQVLMLVLKLRPEVVISTGAAPGVFAIVFSKLFRAKTIWLDSLANSQEISLSARMVKRFADVRLTQWSHLASENDGVEYWGKVF